MYKYGLLLLAVNLSRKLAQNNLFIIAVYSDLSMLSCGVGSGEGVEGGRPFAVELNSDNFFVVQMINPREVTLGQKSRNSLAPISLHKEA